MPRRSEPALGFGEFLARRLKPTLKVSDLPVSSRHIVCRPCQFALQLGSSLLVLRLKLGPPLLKAGLFRSQPVPIGGQ
jgi:hypothetical protein